MFIKYPKIYRLGAKETEGILDTEVIVQEKIDGANLSVWLEDGIIFVGSRNNIVGDKERLTGFRGAVEYCKNHKGIKEYLTKNPNHRLFGEWLVKHTIEYNPEYYNKFRLFDIMVNGEFLPINEVEKIAQEYNIYFPRILLPYGRYNLNKIKKVIKPFYGNKIEGVVIKSKDFVNKYGNKVYAKYIVDEFHEIKKEVWGKSYIKLTPEEKIVNKYVTLGRVKKIINKIEQNEDINITKKDIKKIIDYVFYDVITEEIIGIIDISNIIDFSKLKKIVSKKTAKFVLNILDSNK